MRAKYRDLDQFDARAAEIASFLRMVRLRVLRERLSHNPLIDRLEPED